MSQHVYGLRAETIAVLRLTERPGTDAQLEDSRQAMLVEEARLQELVREYVSTYGADLIRHGDNEYAVDSLARLASWGL